MKFPAKLLYKLNLTQTPKCFKYGSLKEMSSERHGHSLKIYNIFLVLFYQLNGYYNYLRKLILNIKKTVLHNGQVAIVVAKILPFSLRGN